MYRALLPTARSAYIIRTLVPVLALAAGWKDAIRVSRKGRELMARILVVDDDAAIRQLLMFAFSMEGYDVEALSDGRDVVETLRASAERVTVFMDIMMPHVNGLEVCRQLMNEPALLSRHVVVLMSAGITPGEALPGSVRETLAKPFSLDRALRLAEQLGAEPPALISTEGAPEEASAPLRSV